MSAARMSQVIVAKAFTPLPADADKRTIITTLAEALVTAKRLTKEQVQTIVEEAMRREAVGSTGIGHGIAIPHCRTALASDIMCSYGQCREGLDFDSLDGEPVYSVFLLLTPPDRKEDHLALMKSFASQIRKEHFCEFLHQVPNSQSLVELLAEFEAR
jgi:PTS system fructose-specific IIA component/PTS system nitrogen regulatory IIA component